jgi:hypothetical protein
MFVCVFVCVCVCVFERERERERKKLGLACADARTHELSQGSCTAPRGADEALVQAVSQAAARELRWWTVEDIKMRKLKRGLVYSQKRPAVNGMPEAVRSDIEQDDCHPTAESFLLRSSAS